MNTKTKITLSLVISGMFFLTSCSKKKGCTDQTATNYNSDAKENDGSCTYHTAKKRSNEVVINASKSGIGNRTFVKDSIYVLNGFVFVNNAQTLTIKPGTVVEGMPGTGASASALIVSQGGKIMAEGTASEPIIFTYHNDPRDGSTPFTSNGRWGGVILLGKAGLNTATKTKQIEGIPTSEPRGIYGGNIDDDNSGVVKYVSIRHGGTDIGANNEINGLTLGGVGSKTIIDYVEILANKDDGIEFFGGTVNVKHAIVAYCGDDGFDYDQGWRGKGQFWLCILSSNSDRAGEHDGGTDPEDGKPYAIPTISNVTYIGAGTSSRGITFRDNAGGKYYNMILHNFGKGGIDIEDLESGEDSKKRKLANELEFLNVTMSNIAKNPFVYSVIKTKTVEPIIKKGGDTTIVSETVNISPSNPIPASLKNNNAISTKNINSFFEEAIYKGAFEPGTSKNWGKGWTRIFK